MEFTTDSLAELITTALMRWRHGSPVGRRLCIAIDDSADRAVAGITVKSVIRARRAIIRGQYIRQNDRNRSSQALHCLTPNVTFLWR